MLIETLKTKRCKLHPTSIEDANWIFILLREDSIVKAIMGIQGFNADIRSVKELISKMNDNTAATFHRMWTIQYEDSNIGFTIVNNLDKPFINLAIKFEFQGMNFGSEIVECINEYIQDNRQNKEEVVPVLQRKIMRHKATVLFLDGMYCNSLSEIRRILREADLSKDYGKKILNEFLATFRDGSLIDWLYYLGECGSGEAFDIVNAINEISDNDGDRQLGTKLTRSFRANSGQTLSTDYKEYIKLLPEVKIKTEDGEIETNIYQPINLSRPYKSINISIHFEILKAIHDSLSLTINGHESSLNLEHKKRRVPQNFKIAMKGLDEEAIDIIVDEEHYHTIRFQSYPPLDWTSEKCTTEGIRNLYLQHYKKARLCFNKFVSAANYFWLGLMSYIGADSDVSTKDAITFLKKSASLKDIDWSYIATSFLALMNMKGEGSIANLDVAINSLSEFNNEDDGLTLIRKALRGDLESDVFNQVLYTYNIKDKHVTPLYKLNFLGKSIAPYTLLNPHLSFVIQVDNSFSDKIAYVNPENDQLHAHIGITTKFGEWQYVIKDDWYNKTKSNGFIYNERNKNWSLTIDDIYERNNIPEYEEILQLNIVLRNLDGNIDIKPSDNSHFIVDCLTSATHIRLCNISVFLIKFKEIIQLMSNIGLTLTNCK